MTSTIDRFHLAVFHTFPSSQYSVNMKIKLHTLMKLNINYDCYLHTLTNPIPTTLLNLIKNKAKRKIFYKHFYANIYEQYIQIDTQIHR